MPMYCLKDKKTGEETQIVCEYEERDERIKELNKETGKDYEAIIKNVSIAKGSGWRGGKGRW